jgi:eukaryotic-like serine/threonine-protein kinase
VIRPVSAPIKLPKSGLRGGVKRFEDTSRGCSKAIIRALMTLPPGTKLGPYEIVGPLGAGGMGEVYRAFDTRLERTVAVKVLPSHLTSNSDLRFRFEREAKAISGLQHPNICVLHDVGCQDGVDFLVMECLEGETLSARLARKPLTPDESLKIGIEIADALEKAHRGGIVHRDLKPGNVMLTKGGAKLMDFGLAKLQSIAGGPQSGTPAFSAMATTISSIASPVTVAGTLVGTVQYMSPEQIQGKEADARSDIFAFGAMLYEMLTGKRAFEGKSRLSVASSILEKEPEPILAVQPLTPPAMEYVLRSCLAKAPDDRFQSAHDLKLQLQWIAVGGSQVGTPAVVSPRRKNAHKILTAALVAGWIVAAGAGVLAVTYAKRLISAQVLVRTNIQHPAGFDFSFVWSGPPMLSTDGQQIAFVGLKKEAPTQGNSAGNESMIFVHRMSTGEASPVAGTQGGSFPFWSPDGQYLGFFAEGKLKKVRATGGPAQTLCDAPEGRGASWSDRGMIIFAPRIAGPLDTVSDGGGTPVEVTRARNEDRDHTNRNPLFLPDGKHFLFVQRGGKDAVGRVYAGSLDGGEAQQILPAGSNVAYSNGYLFYVKDGTLMGQAFDPGSLRFEGKPTPIAARVEYYNPRDVGFFSVTGNVLVYRIAALQNRELAWLDISGKEVDHWGEPEPYSGGTFSSGSQMSVLYRANPNGRGNSLWLADPQRKTVTRLTADSELEQTGVVSADGNSVLIATTGLYGSSFARRWLTASGKEEKLLEEPPGSFNVTSVSRDGRYVFFADQDPKTSFDIYYMDLQGDRKLVPLLNSPYGEFDARLSPDDKWLAYTSDETGSTELYVAPFPGVGAKWQVSNGGITTRDVWNVMDWSVDGKNLRYQQGDKIFNVEVRSKGSKPEFSAPREITRLPSNLVVISILPDGKRTLAARPTGDSGTMPLDFVLNWQHLVH